MTQNRKPPAFQEYAATMMANIEYRTMSLAERGLLYSMRLECWVNHLLPAEPTRLARVLGFDVQELVGLLPAVMCFFSEDGFSIRCPELDDYRTHLDAVRKRQAEGGRKGAARAHAGRSGDPLGDPLGDPRVTRRVAHESTRGSLAKSSKAKPNTAVKDLQVDDEFVHEMNAYEKASRGT